MILYYVSYIVFKHKQRDAYDWLCQLPEEHRG